MNEQPQTPPVASEFRARLDPYWKSLAAYAVTFIIYIILRATWAAELQSGTVNIVITDPIVVLLGLFVFGAAIALAGNAIARRVIRIGADEITFASRFHEATFNKNEIVRIVQGREQRIRVRGVFRVVRVYIKGRRRPLRIRPALYDNDRRLVTSIMALKPTSPSTS